MALKNANIYPPRINEPANEIHVAELGAEYSTIQEGLDAAVSGDVVIVHPGTYAENITIPSGVRLVGFAAAQNVVISGADTTSTRVTMSDTSTLREVTVVAPSSGSNPAIDCSGLGAAELAVLFNVAIQGGSGSGPGVLGAGSGTLAAIQGLYHNGGAFSAPFVRITAGTCILSEMIANVGSSTDFIEVTGGTVEVQQLLLNPSSLYTCTDLFDISGGKLSVEGVSMPTASASRPATNALHISGDGIEVSVSSGPLAAVTFDILVDGSLTGASTIVHLNAVELSKERTSFPANYFDSADFQAVYLDPGIQNDPALRVWTELSIGTKDAPHQASFGEGDFVVNDMRVWTYDSSTTTYTEVTTAAQSATSSTFTMPTDTGDKLFIGFPSKFAVFRAELTTLAVLGSGVFQFQTWDGSALETMPFMMTGAESPYGQYARQLFLNVLSQNVRLGIDSDAYSDWTARDPGTGESMFYIEITVATANMTTSPVFQRMKIGGNTVQHHKDGFTELFGDGQHTRDLLIHQRLSDDLSGASPGNGTLQLTGAIAITPVDNRFNNSVTDGFGGLVHVPYGLDTSRKITFKVFWIPKSTNTGDVYFRFRQSSISVGDVLDGSVGQFGPLQAATAPGTTDELVETDLTANINAYRDATPNDFWAYSLERLGNDANDTFTGNIDIVFVRAEGSFWR